MPNVCKLWRGLSRHGRSGRARREPFRPRPVNASLALAGHAYHHEAPESLRCFLCKHHEQCVRCVAAFGTRARVASACFHANASARCCHKQLRRHAKILFSTCVCCCVRARVRWQPVHARQAAARLARVARASWPLPNRRPVDPRAPPPHRRRRCRRALDKADAFDLEHYKLRVDIVAALATGNTVRAAALNTHTPTPRTFTNRGGPGRVRGGRAPPPARAPALHHAPAPFKWPSVHDRIECYDYAAVDPEGAAQDARLEARLLEMIAAVKADAKSRATSFAGSALHDWDTDSDGEPRSPRVTAATFPDSEAPPWASRASGATDWTEWLDGRSTEWSLSPTVHDISEYLLPDARPFKSSPGALRVSFVAGSVQTVESAAEEQKPAAPNHSFHRRSRAQLPEAALAATFEDWAQPPPDAGKVITSQQLPVAAAAATVLENSAQPSPGADEVAVAQQPTVAAGTALEHPPQPPPDAGEDVTPQKPPLVAAAALEGSEQPPLGAGEDATPQQPPVAATAAAEPARPVSIWDALADAQLLRLPSAIVAKILPHVPGGRLMNLPRVSRATPRAVPTRVDAWLAAANATAPAPSRGVLVATVLVPPPGVLPRSDHDALVARHQSAATSPRSDPRCATPLVRRSAKSTSTVKRKIWSYFAPDAGAARAHVACITCDAI